MDAAHRNAVFKSTLLCGIISIGMMDLHVPSMPAMVKYFNVPPTQIQYTIGLFLLGFSLFHLLLGPLSDRFGRRIVLLFSLIAGLIGSVMCAIALTVPFLLWGRFIAGIGCGGASLLGRAMMKDAFSGNGKELAKHSSRIGIAISITIGLAPTLGGFVQQYTNWRLNFGISAVVLLGVLVYVLFKLPETHSKPDAYALHLRKILQNFMKPLTSKRFWGYSLCSGAAFSGMIAYATGAPFILQTKLGLSASAFGLLAIFIACSQSIGFTLNARYVHQIGINGGIVIGLGMMLFAGIFLTFITSMGIVNVPVIVLAAVFYVCGGGFIFSNAYVGAFEDFGNITGVCAAVYGLIQVGVASITGFIVASLKEESPVELGVVFMGLALFAGILYHQFIHRAPKRVSPGW